MYPNPIFPTISHQSSIIQDRDLYQPGGVSYVVDTSRSESILKPQDIHHADRPSGGYAKVYLKPIYHISPTISIISILPTYPLSYRIGGYRQDRDLSYFLYSIDQPGNYPM